MMGAPCERASCGGRAGHLHRDPNSDVAEPDPKLPAPTCLVNITWIVARAEPDRSETRQTARARRPPRLMSTIGWCHIVIMWSTPRLCEMGALVLPPPSPCQQRRASRAGHRRCECFQSAHLTLRPLFASRRGSA